MLESCQDVTTDVIEHIAELQPEVMLELIKILVSRTAGLYNDAINKYKHLLTGDLA
jgi:hypothetical protein